MLVSKINLNGVAMDIGDRIFANLGITADRYIELLERDAYTPKLAGAPTGETKTYTDTDGSICDFRLGQSCAYPDGSKRGGYALSVLSAIGADGVYYWEALSYDDSVIKTALNTLQTQVNTLVSGNASAAIESFNEIIAFLANVQDTETLQGIIAGLNRSIADVQKAVPTNTNQLTNGAGFITAASIPTSLPANGGNAATVGGHTVGTDVPANAVFTDTVYNDSAIQAEVAKAIKPANVSGVTTLTGLPVTNYSIKATVSANTPISFASVPPEGSEFMIDILSTAAFTQAIPNGSGWQSDEESLDVEANKVASISIRYVHGVFVVRI